MLGLPYSAGSDIMHLAVLNISDLLISLWHATIDCTKPDNKSSWDWAMFRRVNIWKVHGEAVVNTNITEKLTSGYKAWEFLLYLYGLGPGLLYDILPNSYYSTGQAKATNFITPKIDFLGGNWVPESLSGRLTTSKTRLWTFSASVRMILAPNCP